MFHGGVRLRHCYTAIMVYVLMHQKQNHTHARPMHARAHEGGEDIHAHTFRMDAQMWGLTLPQPEELSSFLPAHHILELYARAFIPSRPFQYRTRTATHAGSKGQCFDSGSAKGAALPGVLRVLGWCEWSRRHYTGGSRYAYMFCYLYIKLYKFMLKGYV